MVVTVNQIEKDNFLKWFCRTLLDYPWANCTYVIAGAPNLWTCQVIPSNPQLREEFMSYQWRPQPLITTLARMTRHQSYRRRMAVSYSVLKETQSHPELNVGWKKELSLKKLILVSNSVSSYICPIQFGLLVCLFAGNWYNNLRFSPLIMKLQIIISTPPIYGGCYTIL